MAQYQHTILIVEDDPALAEMLNAYFHIQGYGVLATAWGEQAVTLATDSVPDLIVLDIHLPDIDGFEVCSRLRATRKTRDIPIIFLTEVRGRPSRLHGLELGVVDYITKPFDVQELRLRVRNTLRRAASAGIENPVTALPEGEPVDERLSGLLDDGWSGQILLIVCLLGLDSFRELYGFVASDDVLRVTALTISTAAREVGGAEAFCGHLDDHTFGILVDPEHSAMLTRRIDERLGGSLEYFYPGDNRGPNATTENRLRLWIGALSEADGPFESAGALRERALAALHAAIG